MQLSTVRDRADAAAWPSNHHWPPNHPGELRTVSGHLLETMLVELQERVAAQLAECDGSQSQAGGTRRLPLRPAALVQTFQESFLGPSGSASWSSRARFVGSAAWIVRRVLVRHAKGRLENGIGTPLLVAPDRVAVTARAEVASRQQTVDLVELDRVMRELERVDARKARLVELRLFGGLSLSEASEALGVSSEEIRTDWKVAKAWVWREIGSAVCQLTQRSLPRSTSLPGSGESFRIV